VQLKKGTTVLGTATVTPSTSDPDVWTYNINITDKVLVVETLPISAYTVTQVSVPAEYTQSVSGFTITNTHRVGPCTVPATSVPDSSKCAYLADASAVKRSAAYQYATVGGTDGASGFSKMLNPNSAATDFVTDNKRATVTWTVSVQEDAGSSAKTVVGSYSVAPGDTFSQGEWSWASAGVQKYLQGVGDHEVSVSLKSSANPSTTVTTWNTDSRGDALAVDVFVPKASVSDSVIAVGDENAMKENIGTTSDGQVNGVTWSDAADSDISTLNNLTPTAPTAALQAKYVEGTRPGVDPSSATDSFELYVGTTFQAQVQLGGPALNASAPTLLGPSGVTSVRDSASTPLVADGATLLVANQQIKSADYNQPNRSIGAPISGAVTGPGDATSNPNGAAFTVYVTGIRVSQIPLAGSAGRGRPIILVALGTLLTAGILAALSWFTRKPRTSTHLE
jgi:hypothetical protein